MSLTSLLRRFTSRKRLSLGLGILAAAIALFGLLGFFWLPGYAKTKLETLLSDAVQRPVTIQSIDIQPYTLELTIRGFRIGEKAASADADKAFLSVDQLYTNLSIASIARRAPVISSLSVRGPTVRLVRESEQHFNITDLIEDFMKRPDDGGKSIFSVSNITIEDGRFEFVDRLKHSHQEISEIRIGVPFIANFESTEEAWVEPHFSARVNGAPLTLDGKLRPFTSNREATLELKLNDVDLTRIDEYSPIPVGINLLSGYFDSDLLLTFTQVAGESPSMILTGRAALRKLEIKNEAVETPYAAKFDRLDVILTEISLSGQKPSHMGLVLTEAVVVRDSESEPVISLPKLSVDEVAIDPMLQSVALGAITLERFKASMHRETDGRLDLVKLLAPSPGRTVPVTVAGPADAETDKPWAVRLGNLKLVAAALRFEDRTLTKVAPMVVDPLDLSVNDVDFSGIAPLKLTLQATVNQRGSLETKGSLAWKPLAVDLAMDAKDIDLVSLQGWAGDRLNALLTRGAASFRGNVKADGVPLKVALNGESRLTNFNLLDKANARDLLRWRSLDINGIDFVSEPLRANVASIAIADFFAHIIISPEGQFNLQGIVRQDDNGEPSTKTASATPSATGQAIASPTLPTAIAANSSPVPARKPIPVHIGRLVMQGGNVNFNDQFIKPNYWANLTGLAGRVGPLDPRKPGEIDIHGAVDKTAPLKIVGKIDTLGSELYLDVTATAKGIDMPTFSPYSGKYVGYAIEKGKLSVDVHYHVEKGELTAENNVFLDQLTLGEEVESADALSIPVNLALALLKNRHGEIDVHLPISGSLNDPQFSIGGLIVKVIVNLLTKAATAPFALLGSLFGGEELSEITFLAGHARITPEAEKRLQALSKALTDRPALKLEITGRADLGQDPEALKRRMLERKVKAQKLSESVRKGEGGNSLDDVELKPEEYLEHLTVVYKEEKFAKPKNMVGLTKSLPAAEMERLMLVNINAGDSEMRQLARFRATAARDWLVEQGGIPSDRVFVLEPRVEVEAASGKSASRADFSLR